MRSSGTSGTSPRPARQRSVRVIRPPGPTRSVRSATTVNRGTSMATPHIADLVALVKSANPSLTTARPASQAIHRNRLTDP
ncbi:S8 family serine peptidase [Streptomyces sp. NPDC005492]|uniref:S8 family serine peptidase n=1 Tax=Streptomyces sp. NPDC005492 TaxID=3156883 RepID=UPI0033B6FF73